MGQLSDIFGFLDVEMDLDLDENQSEDEQQYMQPEISLESDDDDIMEDDVDVEDMVRDIFGSDSEEEVVLGADLPPLPDDFQQEYDPEKVTWEEQLFSVPVEGFSEEVGVHPACQSNG